MVHYGDRRYRLNSDEVAPVMALVGDRLSELVEARINFDLAESLFHVLYRFDTYQVGRPTYPEPLMWECMKSWIEDHGPFSEEPTEAEMMNRFEDGKENAPGTFQATPSHESLKEDLAKCSACNKHVPRTFYCINCGAPIEAEKEAEP
jgi:hypothetical protein